MSGASARGGITLRTTATPLSIVVGMVVIVAGWQVIAMIVAASSAQGDRVMPSLVTVATSGVLGLSDYWVGGFGVPATQTGADQSVAGAVLALIVNAGATLLRVVLGLAGAVIAGVGLGLLSSAVRPVRLSVGGVAEMMRMLPALAMAPLFALWFGATDLAVVLFVIFGVAFIVLVGTINAIGNLPPHVMEYARTMGLKGSPLWVRVVLPAILPEMRGSIVFGGLVAWTSVLAGEIYGLQSGLGWMLNETLRFSLVDRMVVVAAVFSLLALATMKLLGAAMNRLTRWA
ncbi:ABC transporter permease subunit [Microbacterium sp.]|uniref:ABC transporter permease n=1 Tax=Microbacterium sp. TaxID=51671 RepID=UPI00289FC60F|nr:ABC transporter permease subunit [Microbacterium sp.]